MTCPVVTRGKRTALVNAVDVHFALARFVTMTRASRWGTPVIVALNFLTWVFARNEITVIVVCA
ncbi:hypothetical protein DPMN_163332 [Dreissena polymorpha]|uniref:Uncharacterized protein n=1 Tax=Dreissena polymorpha TaxID=45954 RepID=A0A9D4ERX1_DREPO|nr:hypothetical protein DPMN_163332 [Dreissena polymorpha]